MVKGIKPTKAIIGKIMADNLKYNFFFLNSSSSILDEIIKTLAAFTMHQIIIKNARPNVV